MIAGSIASILVILFTRKTLLLTKRLAPYHGRSLLDFIRDKKFGIFRFKRIYMIITFVAIAASFLLISSSVLERPISIKLGSDFKAGTQIILDCEKTKRGNVDTFIEETKKLFPNVGILSQEIKVKSNAVTRHLITLNTPVQIIDTNKTNLPLRDSSSQNISSFGGDVNLPDSLTMLSDTSNKEILTRGQIQNLINKNQLRLLDLLR